MGNKKLTSEIFKQRSIQKFGIDSFDYLHLNYISIKTKVIIKCNTCLNIFEVNPQFHMRHEFGGCPICVKQNYVSNNTNLLKIFIEKASLKYNNVYDYSQVNYVNGLTKVKIICPVHGAFYQTPAVHLSSRSCLYCMKERKLVQDANTFLIKSNIKHDNLYDYSLVLYKNCREKVSIICPIHGEFKQQPMKHQQGNGCPVCKMSRGERDIISWLKNNNIKFEYQKTFDEFKNKKAYYRFDFYIPQNNLCIEYDGEQHFRPYSFGTDQSDEIKFDNFIKLQKRDQIKTSFCVDNNILLLRIPYFDLKNIQNILEMKLK